MPSAKMAISIEESLSREAAALVKKLSTASFLGILGADSSNGKDQKKTLLPDTQVNERPGSNSPANER